MQSGNIKSQGIIDSAQPFPTGAETIFSDEVRRIN